ncbi:protein of unknown function (plasmid) [Azospirillum baldaniorum]|uniref:Uncharacterized protein n=3 Tax=Azospirillum TaxID=191 RepID=A0A9P1NP85_9PROT|nr:protein of unknown function [Azospirillum baldaniorum]
MIVYQAAAGLERWLLRRPWKG